MKKNKKIKKLYIVLLIIVVVASLLLAIALSVGNGGGIATIKKEILYCKGRGRIYKSL